MLFFYFHEPYILCSFQLQQYFRLTEWIAAIPNPPYIRLTVIAILQLFHSIWKKRTLVVVVVFIPFGFFYFVVVSVNLTSFLSQWIMLQKISGAYTQTHAICNGVQWMPMFCCCSIENFLSLSLFFTFLFLYSLFQLDLFLLLHTFLC